MFGGNAFPGHSIASAGPLRLYLGAEGALVVPKLTKVEKVDRDEGVLAGIRRHFARYAVDGVLMLGGVEYTEESLASPFEEHLDAMQRVHELTIELANAVVLERKLEARISPIYSLWKSLAVMAMGKTSPRMREFGAPPHKVWRMTAETKKRANEKRQETRKKLQIVGKKQRAALKKKTSGR
jgi:hypothetical protein